MDTTPNYIPQLTQVGRYRLLERVGAGGMGEVYRGYDPQLERDVAVKLPYFYGPPEERAKHVQRFQREARAAAQIHHPHVCPVYDVGEHDGQPFVVMAFLPGPSLAQRLAASRFEDVDEAVRVVGQLLDGLAAVHARGIVHRDLKPANVLFDAAGRAVLTDFGLARPETDTGLTTAGTVLGSPAYMAPEQAAGQGERAGPWTDLYSLGVVLYQMVTGKLPFEGPVVALLPRIVHEEPTPPRHYRPDLDPALEAVILRALQKDPAKRFRDAAEFAAALGTVLPRPTTPVPASSVTAELPTLVPASPSLLGPRIWPLYRLVGWGVSSLLFLVLSGFLAFLVCAWMHVPPRGSDGILILGVFVSLLAMIVGLLGILFWGWVEAKYVPEALLYLARHGMVERARRTLAGGVPVDSRNDLGETPLLVAAAHGQTEMVKFLVLSGADTTLADPFGQTPLDTARAKGHADIVAVLEKCDRTTSSPPAGAAPDWRPDPRWWLLGTVALGAGLVTALLFGLSERRRLPAEALFKLAEADQIKSLTYGENYALGEVKDSTHIAAAAVRRSGGKFWIWHGGAQEFFSHSPRMRKAMSAQFSSHLVIGEGLPWDCWPGNWVMLPMLLWPMVVLGLGFLPLLGLPNAFPFLALRAKGRGAR
jgi:hypothetical protein